MFVLDFTKPYMYANTIAFYQGNLSTNNTLRCKLKTGSVEDLTGYACTATFYVNGVEIVETCKIIDRASCIVDVVLPSNALVAGEHKMEVILTKPNVSTIQSPMLKYEVWQGLTTGEGIEGTAEYPVLVELINNTQQAIDKTNELQTEVKASLVLANEEIEKIPGKVQQKVDEITSNIDPLIQDMEKNEEIRQANEAERIKEEDIRKANEKARIDAELVREHNDADHEKAEAVRETNEENRRVAEEGRVEAEKLRVKAESDRVVAEDKRVQAENKRQENYDFMTGDEERRRLEENKRIEAEKVRVASETERISEENKRRTVETSRVKAEETRISNENTRIANEETRKTQETQRVQAETDRTTKYDKLVQDTNASIEEFDTFTTQAKTDETTRKRNETNRVNAERERREAETAREASESVRNRQEDIRVARDENRENVFNGKVRAMDAKIAEGTAKITEVNTAKNTMVNDTKQAIDKMKKDFSALTASQQQDAEVILARDGEESLNARLERDLAKGKIVSETLEGSYITCADTVDGIITDIEILGNTIQNPEKLDDIKSVGIANGDGTFNIELVSTTRNMCQYVEDGSVNSSGELIIEANMLRTSYIKVSKGQTLYYKWFNSSSLEHAQTWVCMYDSNKKFKAKSLSDMTNTIGVDWDGYIILYRVKNTLSGCMVSFTPLSANDYVDYMSDRCSIKLPCQLEKVGDIADRLYFDKVENAWCIEKFKKPLDLVSCAYIFNACRENTARIQTVDCRNNVILGNFISNYSIMDNNHSFNNDVKGISVNPQSSEIYFSVPYTDLGVDNTADSIQIVNAWRDFVKKNNTMFAYASRVAEKIVLPLDVQIQLNQFLGTTNVWLECGEVDGTIKATFSKSITATTQSNTKAVDSLETRVKNIEGLKESQDISYDSKAMLDYNGCIMAKETNTSTIKDIKLNGISMKNLVPSPSKRNDITIENNYYGSFTGDKSVIQPGGTYTLLYRHTIKSTTFEGIIHSTIVILFEDSTHQEMSAFNGVPGVITINDKPISRIEYRYGRAGSRHTTTLDFELMCLEGDHRANRPMTHFEGISSVGNGVDKIEISSMKADGNILKAQSVYTTSDTDIEINDGNVHVISNKDNTWGYVSFKGIKVEKNTKYYIKCDEVVAPQYSRLYITDGTTGGKGLFSKYDNVEPIYYEFMTNDTGLINFALYSNDGTKPSSTTIYKKLRIVKKHQAYQPCKSDKKPILFKDTDGAWKSVTELRGLDTVCDTIELHNDGKYYYHVRTEKAILNGTSNYNDVTGYDELSGTSNYMVFKDTKIKANHVISDKFLVIKDSDTFKAYDGACCFINNYGLSFKVLKSSLSTQDDAGFKKFLESNNVLIVHDLAEEKVFEVNPLFLDAFEGETLIQVLSGNINAEIEFRITSYISGLITANTRRIKELENEIYKEQEAQNAVILENDMRIIDLEIALMDAMPTLNIRLGGEDVQERSQLYFDFLKGRIESGSYTNEYLERVINKYLQGKRITQDEYDILYDMIYPPVYDLPQE